MALNKKSLVVAGAVATLGLGSLVGLGAVSAESNNGTSIVEKIAERFNLNKDEVQAVFDEERAAHEAKHKQKLDERLSQAVTDGKITEDQKSEILAKINEMKEFKDSLKDKTHEERREALDTKRDELKQWAEDNDIPLEYLHPFKGHYGGMGVPGPGGPVE
jgi:hypothetical protein